MSSKRFATAMSTDDLGWRDNATMPVEYVAAMAAATHLGSDLFRARDYDQQALRRAILLLASKAIKEGSRKRLPLSRDMASIFSAAVIFERMQFQCRTCKGAAVIVEKQLKVICPDCDGIGVHRYHDKERAKLCGVKHAEWGKWERRYQMIMQITIRHDTAPALAAVRLGYEE